MDRSSIHELRLDRDDQQARKQGKSRKGTRSPRKYTDIPFLMICISQIFATVMKYLKQVTLKDGFI